MAYKISISTRAQKEIENAIDYYAFYSEKAPVKFIEALKHIYNVLETNPFFGIRYKNIRAINIKRFPYSLYFTIDNERNVVEVLSCFNNSRNPGRRPQL